MTGQLFLAAASITEFAVEELEVTKGYQNVWANMSNIIGDSTLALAYLVQLKAGIAYALSLAWFKSLVTSSPVITPTGTSQGVTIFG